MWSSLHMCFSYNRSFQLPYMIWSSMLFWWWIYCLWTKFSHVLVLLNCDLWHKHIIWLVVSSNVWHHTLCNDLFYYLTLMCTWGYRSLNGVLAIRFDVCQSSGFIDGFLNSHAYVYYYVPPCLWQMLIVDLWTTIQFPLISINLQISFTCILLRVIIYSEIHKVIDQD